jgi:hypothetical protein
MPTTPGITAIRCAKASISDGDKNSTIHPSHVPMGLTGVSSFPAAAMPSIVLLPKLVLLEFALPGYFCTSPCSVLLSDSTVY